MIKQNFSDVSLEVISEPEFESKEETSETANENIDRLPSNSLAPHDNKVSTTLQAVITSTSSSIDDGKSCDMSGYLYQI